MHHHQRGEEARQRGLAGHRAPCHWHLQGDNFFNDAKNDGVGLSPFCNLDPVPAGLQAAVDDAFNKMKAGTLDPCQPIDCTGPNLE